MTGRIEGLDVARALAVLAMIQTHAYDAWVAPAHRATIGFAITRGIGTLPLPAFLLLAGVAVGYQVRAHASRGTPPGVLARSLVVRGLGIVAWGYALSGAYMLLDGGSGLDTLLRADVLHVIGLAIALHAAMGLHGEQIRVRRFGRIALVFGLLLTLGSPWINAASPATTGPWRYAVGLFADVPGVTRMPVVPIAAWCSLGIFSAGLLDRTPLLVAAIGAVLAIVGLFGADAVAAALDGPTSRAHPAIAFNVIGLGGRALLVLSGGLWLAPRVRGFTREALLRMGRASLLVYALHLPFCYGRFGRPLRQQLDVLEATAAVVTLSIACLGAVWLWQWVRGTQP